MKIDMKRDEEDSRTYQVTICNKFLVTSTYVHQDRGYSCNYSYLRDSEIRLRAWIKYVKKLCAKRNNNRNLLVALSAESSLNYASGSLSYANGTFKKGNGKQAPYELLQLCVGNNCLLYELAPLRGVPKVLKDFLYDETVVMGVGIHKLAVKLQKEYGILFRKCVELKDLAGLEEREQGTAGVAEVARVVTGGEMNYVRPTRINWWHNLNKERRCWLLPPNPLDVSRRYELLSDDLKKHATVEAFLVHHVGTQLLKNFHKF